MNPGHTYGYADNDNEKSPAPRRFSVQRQHVLSAPCESECATKPGFFEA